MDKKNETDKKPESKYFKEPFRKQILDELELDRYCCRRHMLSHVDIIDYL
jgi:DNA-directed RNA polymerase subunit N (RpoN/RPB10)